MTTTGERICRKSKWPIKYFTLLKSFTQKKKKKKERKKENRL